MINNLKKRCNDLNTDSSDKFTDFTVKSTAKRAMAMLIKEFRSIKK